MPDPENDLRHTGGEFGEGIANGIDDATVPAKPGDEILAEDETEAHPR